MKLMRRILLTIVVTLVVVFVVIQWIAPVALSYYAVEKAPPIVRVVPSELKNTSISQTSETELRYFGYVFEIPWTDLDETKTALFPKDKPEKNRVDLHFQSGLRLIVSAGSSRDLVDGLPKELNLSSQEFESAFGKEALKSDYDFLKAVYEFTPDKINHWDFRQGPLSRDELFLTIKSIVPAKEAESGIFNVSNQDCRGFQQGDPQRHPDRILLDLYSEKDGVEMLFIQKEYRIPSGITQPEINRVVQSLRRIQPQ